MPRNEIFKADELSSQDRALWISLIESSPLCSPLLHPDFVRLVATCRRDVRIIKSQDGHGIGLRGRHDERLLSARKVDGQEK